MMETAEKNMDEVHNGQKIEVEEDSKLLDLKEKDLKEEKKNPEVRIVTFLRESK